MCPLGLYRLRTFGALAIESGGVPVEPLNEQRKRLGVLVFLAASAEPAVPRERLVALFWPESSTEDARNSLNQAIFGIRRTLGPDAIRGSAELRLDDSIVWTDCTEFRRAMANGALEDAIDLYRGRFLDGFFVRGARELEAWIDSTAARFHSDYEMALERLAESAGARGDSSAALRHWRQLVEAEPLSSRYAKSLMRALDANGDREAAIQHGVVYMSMLRAELSAQPDDGVASLVAELRARSQERVAVRRTPATAHSTEPVALTDVAVAPSPPAVVLDRTEPAQHRRRRVWIVAGLGALSLTIFAFAFANRENATAHRPLGPATRVMVLPFEDRTGDTSLHSIGDMAADWIAQGIEQSGTVRVVDRTIAYGSSFARAPKPESVSIDLGSATTKARQFGAKVAVWGAVDRRGDSVVFSARIADSEHGNVLAVLDPIAVSKREPIRGAELLRARVAGAFAALTDVRLASISHWSSRPPTFEAYREYIAGLKQFQRMDELSSVSHFAAAARLDTTFATPFIWTIFAFGNTGHYREADSVLALLEARRGRLSPVDELALDYFVARRKGDVAAQYQAALAASRLTPGSNWSHNAALIAYRSDHLRESAELFADVDAAHGWAQGWANYWHDYGEVLHLLGRYGDEAALAERAESAGSPTMGFAEVSSLVGRGRVADANNRLASLIGLRSARNAWTIGILLDFGRELDRHGHRNEAISAWQRAIAWAQSPEADEYVRNRKDTSATRLALRETESEVLYELGRLGEADSLAARLPRTVATVHLAGLVAAARGDTARARTIAQFMLGYFPATPSLALRVGRLYAAIGDRDLALEYLERATTLEHVFLRVHECHEWAPFRKEIEARFAGRSLATTGWTVDPNPWNVHR